MSYLIYLRKSRKDLENPFMTTEEILNRHECILLDLARKMNLSIGDIYREIVSGDSIVLPFGYAETSPRGGVRAVGRCPCCGGGASRSWRYR